MRASQLHRINQKLEDRLKQEFGDSHRWEVEELSGGATMRISLVVGGYRYVVEYPNSGISREFLLGLYKRLMEMALRGVREIC